MRIVNKIEAKTPQMPRRKRVAAYARVSMESERLQHSLSAQVSFYSSLIQSNPAWEYVGVYADNGITGTKAEAREEFNRMIADCEAGKIDIVLTKSISLILFSKSSRFCFDILVLIVFIHLIIFGYHMLHIE